MFETALRMVKTNEDIISEQCRRMMAVYFGITDEYTKTAWKILDTFEHRVCSSNKNIFPEADAVSDVHCLIRKGMLEGQ